MATSKISTSIVLLIAIFLSSCSGYEEKKYIFYEPAYYEYKCRGSDCKKVNTNVFVEVVVKDKYKDLSEEELEKGRSRQNFLKSSISMVNKVAFLGTWAGISLLVGYTSTQSSGLAAGILAGGAMSVFVSPIILWIIWGILGPDLSCRLTVPEGDEKYIDEKCSRDAKDYEIEDIKKVEEMDRIRARVQGKKE